MQIIPDLAKPSLASSWNGIGTALYGETDKRPDGSYITTKWLIFFLLPIVPLKSYRLKKDTSDRLRNIVGMITDYQVIELLPINKRQVRTWYLSVYGTILLCFVILIYLSNS